MKNPNRRYLAPDLNVSKMYELFKEPRTPVSEHAFRSVFNHEYHLCYHAPLQGTCKTCDTLSAKLRACDIESEKHKLMAHSARKGLQDHAAHSKIPENDVTVVTFDLQKTLPTPVPSTGIVYYKQQLWNFGMHCMNDNVAYMYVWDESVASRGPQKVASVLLFHLKKHIRTKNLIRYSDCCGGQNRNLKNALLWSYVTQSNEYTVENIDHKFLIPGHTFLPIDQDFGLVEKNKRYHSKVFVPKDWMKVIESAKKREPKFVVTRLAESDFISTKKLEESTVNRKLMPVDRKIHWLH